MTTQQFTAARLRGVLLPDITTARDLAPFLGLSVTGLRAVFRRGDLPARKIGGRWIVSRRALLAEIEAGSRIGMRLVRAKEVVDAP